MKTLLSIPAFLLLASCTAIVQAKDPTDSPPPLDIRHADGSRATDLRLAGDASITRDTDGTTTVATYKDAAHALSVRVCRKTYDGFPVVEQWVEIENGESGPVVLERVASSARVFRNPAGIWLKRNSGKYANELNPSQAKLTEPVTISTSKICRVSQDIPPFFILSSGGAVREDAGEVTLGSIVWNGDFAFDILPAEGGTAASCACGINSKDSRYTLDAGKTFVAPRMLWATSTEGMGGLSRMMHRFVRAKVLRDGDKPRPVLLNNWEATGFNFNEKRLTNLFATARDANFELFLLDDGWFGAKHPRNSDNAGLGDWMVNPAKLPHGVSGLCEEAAKRGVAFGIWIEPEMVNPRSELFEKHPDWAIGADSKPLDLQRNQLVLDLSRPEVREFAFKSVDDLLAQNPGISYLKWDCNRFVTRRRSPWLAADRQENLPVDYANALDDVMGRLVARHPGVEMMLCAGGGGRIDLRSLRHFHEFWPTDNTDPVRRVTMQWEYSALYPAISVCAHVTHSGHRPLKFAFDVAMSGRLGADLDLSAMSRTDRAFAAQAVKTYRDAIRPVLQTGDLYRLESPYEGPRAAMDVVLPDRSAAILFVYQLKDAPKTAAPAAVCLRGLDPAARYRVRELNLPVGAASVLAVDGKVLFGKELMETGLVPTCRKALESMVVRCEKIP